MPAPRSHYLCSIVSLLLCGLAPALGDTVLFTSEQEWLASVSGQPQQFAFSAANVALSEEVVVPPPPNTPLGVDELTFLSSSTGLTWDFAFQNASPQPSSQLIYTVDALGVMATSEHDWQVELMDGPDATAIALHTSENLTVDTLRVYDESLSQIDAFAISPGMTFMGLVSDVAIGAVRLDDSTAQGGRVISQVAIVPEPSTTVLIVAGFSVLSRYRGQRNIPA